MTLKEPHEMNENKTTPQVLHIFWDTSFLLSTTIIKNISTVFPTHQYAIYQVSKDRTKYQAKNFEFIHIAGQNYFGWIAPSLMTLVCRKFHRCSIVAYQFVFSISIFSFVKLILGPKHIILHGRSGDQFNLITLLLLKMFGKKFYLIHWGGKPRFGRFFGGIDKIFHSLFSHIFVLMTPEIDYYISFMDGRVSCLPYRLETRVYTQVEAFERQDPRRLILGNSTFSRELYCEILDRLSVSDWGKITCMLNYGDEGNADKTDEFVKRYQNKFGDVFFAWRTILPFDEYLNVIHESTFYFCISKTQTGLGAIYNSIRQGKTLILRGDNYKWVKSLGVKVYNYDDITTFSFEELNKLRLTEQEAQKSLENYNKNFAFKYTFEFWKSEILRIITKC